MPLLKSFSSISLSLILTFIPSCHSPLTLHPKAVWGHKAGLIKLCWGLKSTLVENRAHLRAQPQTGFLGTFHFYQNGDHISGIKTRKHELLTDKGTSFCSLTLSLTTPKVWVISLCPHYSPGKKLLPFSHLTHEGTETQMWWGWNSKPSLFELEWSGHDGCTIWATELPDW